MSVGLGVPSAPPPVLAPRRKTRQLMVRDVGVGSDYPISTNSTVDGRAMNRRVEIALLPLTS